MNIDKSGWKLTKLGDLATDINKRVENPSESAHERFVGLEHFVSGDLKIKSWNSTEGLVSATKEFEAGDILFARRNAYLKRASMVDFSGVCSGDAFVLRENHEKVVPGFISFVVNSEPLWTYANSNAAGTMSKRVKWRDLANYEFLLPPKDQQAKLAEFLWAADAVVNKKNHLFQSVNQTAETYIERNLTSPSEEGSLSDYCEKDGIKIGPFGSLLHKEDYQSDGIAVVMPTDIVDGVIQEDSVARISEDKAKELANYRLEENDILFPRRGDLTKRALVEPHQTNWICGTGTIRVRLKEGISPLLVYYAVTSSTTNRRLLDSAVGTTMPNLNSRAIKKIPLHLPSGDSSNRILSELKLIFRSKAKLHSNLQHSRGLLKALINEIFSQPA